jgi:hypothetical protein
MRFLGTPTMVLALALLTPGRVQADCGLNNVVVETQDHQDRRIACTGLHRALDFLAPYELSLTEPIRIRFMEHGEDAFLAEKGTFYAGGSASGYYDASTSCAVVVSSRSLGEGKGLAFRSLPATGDMLASTVTHEVVHHVYHHLCAARGHAAEHAAAEYLAYVAQIGTLEGVEQTKVLQLWPGEVLPSRYAVNLFLWAHDPPRFGIMAYRFHQRDPRLFHDILAGHFVASDQSIPAQ